MSDFLPEDFEEVWEELGQLELDLDVYHEQRYVKEDEPKNNSGRSNCYWCGKPTEKRKLLTSIIDICPECER